LFFPKNKRIESLDFLIRFFEAEILSFGGLGESFILIYSFDKSFMELELGNNEAM